MPFIKAYYVKLQTLVIQHIGFKTSVLFLKDFAFNYGYVCRYIGRVSCLAWVLGLQRVLCESGTL